MSRSSSSAFVTSRRDTLGLTRIVNRVGTSISMLPSGAIFAIEHERANRRIMINQLIGSPIAQSMGRLLIRTGGAEPMTLSGVGAEPSLHVGAADDRFVWEGERSGVRHRVTLSLLPRSNIWLWRAEVMNARDEDLPCDAILSSGSWSRGPWVPDEQ